MDPDLRHVLTGQTVLVDQPAHRGPVGWTEIEGADVVMGIEGDQPDPAPVGGQRSGQRAGNGVVPTEVDAQRAPVQLGGQVLDHLRHAMHIEVGDRPIALVTDGDTTEIDSPFAVEGGETAESITDLERAQVGPRRRQRGAGRRHTDHQDLRVGMLLGEPDIGARPVWVIDRHWRSAYRCSGCDP